MVKNIYHWFIEEGYSKTGIARRLNQMGEPNPGTYKKRKGLKYYNPNSDKNDGLWSAGSLPYSSCILSYGILRWLPRLPGRYACQEPSPRRVGRTVRRQLSRYRSLFLRCGCIRSRTPRICRPPIHEAPALQSLRRSSHNTVSLLFLVFYSQSHRKNQK